MEGFEAVAAGRDQKRAGLVRGERADLLLLALRQPDTLGGVAWDKAVGDRLVERLLQHAVHLADRGATQAPFELLAVEVAHVDRGEGLELGAPKAGTICG